LLTPNTKLTLFITHTKQTLFLFTRIIPNTKQTLFTANTKQPLSSPNSIQALFTAIAKSHCLLLTQTDIVYSWTIYWLALNRNYHFDGVMDGWLDYLGKRPNRVLIPGPR